MHFRTVFAIVEPVANEQHSFSSSYPTTDVAMAAISSTSFFQFSFHATSPLSLKPDFPQDLYSSL
jgi:hypothetical protein